MPNRTAPILTPAAFDVIVSRQLCNGLYDPLTAFKNWLHWLTPGGTLLIIDGIYDRDAWDGEMKVDTLPLAACRTIATVPYLLDVSGFDVVTTKWMTKTNERPLARTPRYAVIAKKPDELAEEDFFGGFATLILFAMDQAELLTEQSSHVGRICGQVSFPKSTWLLDQTIEPLKSISLHPRRSLGKHARVKSEGGADGDQRHVDPGSHLVREYFLTRTTQTDETDTGSAGVDFFRQLVTFAFREGSKTAGLLTCDSQRRKLFTEPVAKRRDHFIRRAEEKDRNPLFSGGLTKK